jgi:hypothetical protein
MPADNQRFCLMLRTKSGYFRSAVGERMIDPDNTTACYTCLITQRPFGPDGMPADPESCTSTRACFKPEI